MKQKHNWVSIDYFNKKYSLDPANIHVSINQGAFPRSVLKNDKRESLRLQVDENYFLRRKAFRIKVKNYIQDMYFLVATRQSDMQMAKTFGVYVVYFADRLWNRPSDAILNYRIPKAEWKVFKLMRRLEMKIRGRYGITFDISEILDNEARMSA